MAGRKCLTIELIWFDCFWYTTDWELPDNLIMCKGCILELIFLSVPNWFTLTNLNKWSWYSDGLKGNSIFSWDDRTDRRWCRTTPHCFSSTWLSKMRVCESFPECFLAWKTQGSRALLSPSCLCFRSLVDMGAKPVWTKGWLLTCEYEQRLLVKAHAWQSHSAAFTM